VRITFVKRPTLNAWNRAVPTEWVRWGGVLHCCPVALHSIVYVFCAQTAKSKSNFWWFSQLSSYVFRPLPHVLTEAIDFSHGSNAALGGPWDAAQTTLALHVRSGDRYKNHITPVLSDTFLRHSTGELQQIEAVFIATDDADNLDEATAFKEQHGQGPPLFWDESEDRRSHVRFVGLCTFSRRSV